MRDHQTNSEASAALAPITKPQLQLLQAGDCWAVDYSHTTDAARIADLFGSTLIPTAFTRDADGATVQELIQRLNPTFAVVRIGGGK